MSVEELLKDRYKVIADYPQSPFATNEIIEFTTNEQKIVWMLTISGLSFSELSKYPHLFRKLEWWEDRKEDEMPEYLKIKYEYLEIIEKVNGYYFNKYGELFCFRNEQKTERININNSGALPTTESEYLQQNTLVK